MNKLTDINHPYLSMYDKMISENPGKMISILAPTCIHIFKGTSLEDAVNVEIFPYDFIRDDITEEQFVSYKEQSIKSIRKLELSGISKVLDFYKSELSKNYVFTTEKSKRFTYGLGNFAFIEYKFRGFLNYEDVYPLKEDTFEGTKVYIPNNPQRTLECLYGNYMGLPSDIGIAHSIEDINDYLKRKNRNIISYRED